MIIYSYSKKLDQTTITDPANSFFHTYPGQLDYKFVHSKYDTLVFEILKDPEPLPLLFADEDLK